MKKIVTLFMVGLLSFAGCDVYESITVQDPGWFPEGIAFDAGRNEFLVTSLSRGTVSRVTPEGEASVFINDENLKSTFGIKVDLKRKRILVANGDPGATDPSVPPTAGLGVYHLETGERIRYINLAQGREGLRLANDIALDKQGNIYVTDSAAPVIYKVDLNYTVTEFATDPRFGSDQLIDLNGLVYHPIGDYLLVAKGDEGRLFRVPLSNPELVTEVALDLPLTGADGMLLLPDGRLVVVQNWLNQVSLLASDDDWAGSRTDEILTHDNFDFPTTATLAGSSLMILNGKLGSFLAGNPAPETQFEIFSFSLYHEK